MSIYLKVYPNKEFIDGRIVFTYEIFVADSPWAMGVVLSPVEACGQRPLHYASSHFLAKS
jgi:hypothetical protein